MIASAVVHCDHQNHPEADRLHELVGRLKHTLNTFFKPEILGYIFIIKIVTEKLRFTWYHNTQNLFGTAVKTWILMMSAKLIVEDTGVVVQYKLFGEKSSTHSRPAVHTYLKSDLYCVWTKPTALTLPSFLFCGMLIGKM